MVDVERLKSFVESDPQAPQGWFRQLHDHCSGRYLRTSYHVTCPGYEDVLEFLWQDPDPTKYLADAPQLWIALLNRHASLAGAIPLQRVFNHFLAAITPEARGAYAAAGLERQKKIDNIDFIKAHIASLEFTPDTLCQIGCYVVRVNDEPLLDALLGKDVDILARIDRDPVCPGRDSLPKLSNRVVDMLLEVAVSWERHEMVRNLLGRGADPNIPIWQWERSFNQRYSALSYAIAHRCNEAIDALLEAGASGAGTKFEGLHETVYYAVKNRNEELLERLLENGGSLAPLPTDCWDNNSYIPPMFCVQEKDLEWVQWYIAPLVPLVGVSEKKWFFEAGPQVGSFHTLLCRVMSDVDRLKHYDSMGLDSRLTAEEVCRAMSDNAFDSLEYLFGKYAPGNLDNALQLVEKKAAEEKAAQYDVDDNATEFIIR